MIELEEVQMVEVSDDTLETSAEEGGLFLFSVPAWNCF